MTNNLIVALAVVGLLTACGGRGTRADQKDYEVVEEGSVQGVTSTIAGPGETVPPITGTNSDTTTAFTLDPNAVPPPTPQPGSIAGTLPPPMPAAPPPMTQRPPGMTLPPQPRPVQPPPPTQTEPAPQEPVEPPPTDTTETAPPPPPEEPPPPTDTTTTTPPPPPPR